MKHWIARLLSRRDIELHLDASSTSSHFSLLGEMKDIHEATAVQSLRGPDSMPFISPQRGGGLRLIFSLCTDGLNAFGKKVGGGPASVTAIYLACLSLPIEERFHPENMYLAGVIPGPHKPSEDEINHFLAPLVDDLLEFWDPGVYFTKTHAHPTGRLVRAALIPLVSDILAARQTGGFSAHSATLFCSLCYLQADKIESFDIESWPKRTAEKHRKHALAWKKAKTSIEKREITKEYGVRFSELLRLSYWDPIHFTIIDSMHLFFLRIIPQHIRNTWGVNPAARCGDGYCVPGFQPPSRPSNAELAKGLQWLQQVSQEKNTASLKRPVLWSLCQEFDLRRAGSNAILSQTLINWVSI